MTIRAYNYVTLTAKVLLRALDASAGCESLCSQLADVQVWNARVGDPNLVVKSVSRIYFRCYLYHLANNENFVNLPTSGADIQCAGSNISILFIKY